MPESQPPTKAFTIASAAAACDLSEKAIRAAIHSGHLRAKRAGRDAEGRGVGKYLILAADLDRYLDELPPG